MDKPGHTHISAVCKSGRNFGATIVNTTQLKFGNKFRCGSRISIHRKQPLFNYILQCMWIQWKLNTLIKRAVGGSTVNVENMAAITATWRWNFHISISIWLLLNCRYCYVNNMKSRISCSHDCSPRQSSSVNSFQWLSTALLAQHPSITRKFKLFLVVVHFLRRHSFAGH